MDRDSMSGFGIGFLVGAVIGGTLALLYAPRSGSETRQIIRERAEDVKERAQDIIEKAREKTGEVVERAKSVAGAK